MNLTIWRTTEPKETSLERDWFGNPSLFEPAFSLQLKEQSLVFRFRALKARSCQDLEQGTFVEGLWQHDVAELFFQRSGEDSYRELNVSPTGAFWCAAFSSYRQLDQELRFDPLRIIVARDHTFWSTEFELPLDVIPGPPEEWRMTVTSILYDPEPHYFCYGYTGHDEPDFHRSQNFLPVVLN